MSETGEALFEQALEWYVLLQDTDASGEDRQRCAEWLAESEAHRLAWQRAEQAWKRLDPLAEALIGQDAPDQAIIPPPNPVMSHGHKRFRRVGYLATAALLLIALGVGLYDPAWRADYRTGVAELRQWTLEDGSQVHLDADSALDIDYSTGQRRIRLLRGQAWFQVAADAGRPFVVEAGGGSTTALGTAFAVERNAHEVKVVVSEHSVRVDHRDQERTLRQGQAMAYGPGGISSVRDIDLNQAMSWRTHRLVFQDAPLSAVLAELQRHIPAYLYLADKKLGQLPVTAIFDTRQPEQALESLAEVLPLTFSGIGPWVIRVQPRG